MYIIVYIFEIEIIISLTLLVSIKSHDIAKLIGK